MGCDKGDSNWPRSQFGGRLSRDGPLLNTGASLTTADSCKQEVDFEKAFFPTLLDHTVVLTEKNSPDARLATVSNQTAYWKFFGSQRLHQAVFMSPRNDAERVLNVVELEKGEPGFLTCVTLRVKNRDGLSRSQSYRP